jgi:hypothetical protein
MSVVKLRNVRIAFCQNLFKAGAMEEKQTPKFSSTFIIAKDAPEIAVIKKTIEQVAKDKWLTKADQVLKGLRSEGRTCLKDGDAKAQYEGFEGNMYVAASTDKAPKVWDKDKTELSAQNGRPYAGCYVHASIDIWAQDNKYGKRVNATLRAVMFSKDGDAFAGAAPATDEEFDDLADTGDEEDSLA